MSMKHSRIFYWPANVKAFAQSVRYSLAFSWLSFTGSTDEWRISNTATWQPIESIPKYIASHIVGTFEGSSRNNLY